jgi:hypothetical protein
MTKVVIEIKKQSETKNHPSRLLLKIIDTTEMLLDNWTFKEEIITFYKQSLKSKVKVF